MVVIVAMVMIAMVGVRPSATDQFSTYGFITQELSQQLLK